MATFEIVRGATSYNISAGQSICLAEIDDLGGASVRNLEESGPFQDGASHLGYRLEPRTMTLRLYVVASTAAALDTARDTLNAMFKPVAGVPIVLRVTRDDSEIRQIDCQRAGPLSIPLRPENYPGHLYRAVVQLRAADPTFYNATEQSLDFLSPSDWWLAYNTIGTANVLEHVESPGTAQLWANTGSAPENSPWSVFFRSGSVTPAASNKFAFSVLDWDGVESTSFGAGNSFTGGYAVQMFGHSNIEGAWMVSGTANYITSSDAVKVVLYRDGTALGTATSFTGGTVPGIPPSSAGTARWRANYTASTVSVWPSALPYAAAYNIALSATQRAALAQAVADGGSAYSAAIVYEGDVDSYPIVTLNGPIANPVITNTTTGDVLNFSAAGGTIAEGGQWIIDTRYGRKSVLSGTTSVAQYLSSDSDLATFRLVADPIATGGTNVISVGGSLAGTATSVEVAWYNRFLDY